MTRQSKGTKAPKRPYKARVRRSSDPSRYVFTYGRGARKLFAEAWYNDLAKGWVLTEGSHGYGELPGRGGATFAHLRDIKAAWQISAEQAYYGATPTSPLPAPALPSLPPLPPLPVRRPLAPPGTEPSPEVPRPVDRLADAFDPRFWERGDGLARHMTSLGVLEHIYRHFERQQFATVHRAAWFDDVVRELRRRVPDKTYQYPARSQTMEPDNEQAAGIPTTTSDPTPGPQPATYPTVGCGDTVAATEGPMHD